MDQKIKLTVWGIVALSGLALAQNNPGTAKIILCGKEITARTHQIVVPEKPTIQETHAAKELKKHLWLISGQILEIMADSKADSKYPLIVGRSALIQKYGKTVDFGALGLEGIRILADEKCTLLAGNQRGVLYAVYTFLEDYCGCRWFALDCTKIPNSGEITIKPIDLTYHPPFEYRHTDYMDNGWMPEFNVRNKLNGLYSGNAPEWGESAAYVGFVHTFDSLLPPAKYFATHPEYFALINGKRVGTPGLSQPCLTNPDVLRIVTANVRQWLRENPKGRIVSVSQNDYWDYCHCPKCEALAQKEGSQAGPLLHFVNAIADNIKDDYPNVLVDTLAYVYTRKAPLHVKPRPNVVVRLCTEMSCRLHPFKTCPANKKIREEFADWNRISKRLYVWDYVTDFRNTLQPFPNLYVLQPNIQFMARHGVVGIFEEGVFFSRGGEMANLRTFLMAKLLWNPDYNVERGVTEFTDAFYGPAAPFIRDYIHDLHNTVCRRPNLHIDEYAQTAPSLNDPALLDRADRLFDRAEAAVASDPTFLHRVRVARMGIQFTRLELARSVFQLKGDTLVPAAGANPQTLTRLTQTMNAEHVTKITCACPDVPEFAEWSKRVTAAIIPLKLVIVQNEKIKVSIIPQVGGRVWSIVDKSTGRELLKQFGRETEGWNPFEGGIEEYSQGGTRSPGWSEPYRIVSVGTTFVELEATLSNTLKIWRRLELPAGGSALKLASRLTNTGKAPAEGQLRLHPEFRVDNVVTAFVTSKTPQKEVKITLADPANPVSARDVWMPQEILADGGWTLIDPQAGRKITLRFDPKQVERGLVYYTGTDRFVTLELYSKKVAINPGQTLNLDCEYSFSRISPK